MVGSVGLGALPANAATAGPNARPSHAIGKILCRGDLCVQTLRCSDHDKVVSINVWANNRPFFGHFSLNDPNGKSYNSRPKKANYFPGHPRYEFTVGLLAGELYHAKAWKESGGEYYNIGEVHFSVVTCS
jgi:hypothetical protein